ncbi:hypothetical protein SAMN05192534_110121 [Alteribacillus persepolensis]|uniref:Uncharacterized protein n=1 Tax=Alteribacillus persepolensis TaxID=568899 RepID=A0A1G8EYD4_9BACI|nr:hypothetical protein [Alteribacillus persepolensis]SDH74921.1 hypothetical protein SAMN05192534_110121 [Alteribacillus persepolensis]
MTVLHKTAAILMVLCIVFPLAIPVNTTAASDINFDYGEDEPTLTQTEGQGRDTGSSGGNSGGGDIPGGTPKENSPGFWGSIWNWGKEVVQEAGSTVAEFMGDAGESLGDAVSSVAPNLGEKIKEYSNQLEDIIKGLTNPASAGEFFRSLGKGMFALSPIGGGMVLADLLSSGAVDAWNAMPDWAQGLLKGLAVGVGIAAAIIGGAFLLAGLGVIAAGTLLTAAVLAGIGALGAAIYGAIAGGENFSALTASGIVLGTVFIPLSGKIAGAVLSTRMALMLGARAHLAFGSFSGWAMTKLSAGWASISGFLAANKMGFLIGGGIPFAQHVMVLWDDPSAFDMKMALVDIAAGTLTGGLLAGLGSGFMALARADKWKRVLAASGIGGSAAALSDWVLGNGLALSSFLTGALITSIFFPMGAHSMTMANQTIGKALNPKQKTTMNQVINVINGVKQTVFTNHFKKPITDGFHKLGEMFSNGWNRLTEGNLSNVEHVDTEQLQHNIDEKTNSRS